MRGSLKSLLTIGMLTLGILTASPAHAAPTDPTVTVTSATLVNKGVALDVTVAITCDLGSTYYNLNVEIYQRNGKLRTRGGSFIGFGNCTGTPQERSARILAFEGLFKTGAATGLINVTICDEAGDCSFNLPINDDNIRITK